MQTPPKSEPGCASSPMPMAPPGGHHVYDTTFLEGRSCIWDTVAAHSISSNLPNSARVILIPISLMEKLRLRVEVTSLKPHLWEVEESEP